MELAERWLEAQRATPSFVTHFDTSVTNILDAPLPAALRSSPVSSYSAAAHAHHDSPAARTPRTAANVHDDLINRGKLYEQRREALRERAIAEEQKRLRSQPRISREAQGLRRDGKIEDRLLRLHKEKEEHRLFELMKHAKRNDERLAQVATFTPKLSHRGHRATAKATMEEHHETWQRRREQKLDMRKSEAIVKELAEVRDGPSINLRSQRLAMKRREREGLAQISHVEAMLEHDRLAKLALWERQQREAEAVVSNPKITLFAASINRGGDPGSRLYAESVEVEQRRAQRMREALDQHTTSVRTPRITRTARSHGRSRPVEDELMQRHLDAMAAREEALRLLTEQEHEVHTPAINPVSDAIAARLPQSSRERLYAPRDSQPSSVRRADPNVTTPLTHATSAARSSRGTAQHRSVSRSSSTATGAGPPAGQYGEGDGEGEGDRGAWLEALQKEEERRQERLRDLRAEQEARELEGCTFAPQTTPKASAVRPGGNVQERVQQWARKREMKLEEQRAQRVDADLQGCTFAPETSAPRARPPAETIYGADGTPWGMDEYVRRQEEARRRRQEQEARQTTPTRNWRPQATQPREFQLGRARTPPVRALQRPVPPPAPGAASPALRREQPRADSGEGDGAWLRAHAEQRGLPQQGYFSSAAAAHPLPAGAGGGGADFDGASGAAESAAPSRPLVPPSMW